MVTSFDDIVFCLILVLPIAFFAALAKKNWSDKSLRKAYSQGLFAGCAAIVIVRFIYIPISAALGGDMRDFLAAPREWWITLIASIGIVGFIEEGIKAFVAHFVCCINGKNGFRPTFVFLSFAGCALSFSLLENVQYYLAFGPSVVMPRVIVSSVAHLFFASICGYFSALGFKREKTAFVTSILIGLGIIIAAVLHGAFDFMLFHFTITATNGLVLCLIALFCYIIYEVWIKALINDLPQESFLAVCSKCRALTLEKIRFCPFCGYRVNRVEHFPTIMEKKEIKK